LMNSKIEQDIQENEAITNILGVGVSAINMNAAVEKIGQWIAQGSRQYVCVSSVNNIMECRSDKRLRVIHNRAGMVTPDGMPLVWLSRLSGKKHVSRVYGPDLLLAVCERSLQTGWSHYFYGGSPEALSRMQARLADRYPGLNIAGAESPPFRPLTEAEDQAAVDRINASGADILCVRLGAPKQEYWMADHLERIKVPVMIGVGAAFDFHAGTKKQAPHWMQRSGLEWFFRLCSEPKRLWKRYLINNPLFVALTLLQAAKMIHYPLEN